MKCKVILLFFVLFFATTSYAMDPTQIHFEKYWADLNHYALTSTQHIGEQEIEYEYDFKLYDKNNFKVEVVSKQRHGIDTRARILIEGSVILVKGFKGGIAPLDEMDMAALQLQIFQRILVSGTASDPEDFGIAPFYVEIYNEKYPLVAHTLSATAELGAPWKASGNLTRLSYKRYDADLTLTYTQTSLENDQRESDFVFKGIAEYDPDIVAPSDSLRIQDWAVVPIAMQVDGEVVGEWAKNLSSQYQTLGELREYLSHY